MSLLKMISTYINDTVDEEEKYIESLYREKPSLAYLHDISTICHSLGYVGMVSSMFVKDESLSRKIHHRANQVMLASEIVNIAVDLYVRVTKPEIAQFKTLTFLSTDVDDIINNISKK